MLGFKPIPLVALGLLACGPVAHAQTVVEQPDKYIWLEDVWGKRSIDWVKSHNQRTQTEIKGDPRFAGFERTAKAVLESPDRLATPRFTNGKVFNFWQDAKHVRGILRVTTFDGYLASTTKWKTVLDVDALAKRDKRNWVMGTGVPLLPGDRRMLVELSDGGEDATTLREFDLEKGQFVKNGFSLPKSKQQVTWPSQDELLVATDWGKGSMTDSGYPFIVKSLRRGQPLSKAVEVFRGKKEDTWVGPATLDDGHGRRVNLIQRALDFFRTEQYVLAGHRPLRLDLPGKVSIIDAVAGQCVFYIDEDWTPSGSKRTFAKGSLLSVDLGAMQRDPAHLNPRLIFEPTASEFYGGAQVTKNCVILTTLLNVQGQAYACRVGADGQWTKSRLKVPANSAVEVVSANRSDDRFVLSVVGFLRPTSFYLGDGRVGSVRVVKSRKSQFDASNLVAEQNWTVSRDGTRVPYFLVRRKDMPFDGSTPTHMTAYGGFNVPMAPYYDAVMGKLWLERGGAFVLANIRGGSEFGPAWHDAGLKTNRQRIYDDFAAVAEDLVRRRVTSAAKLGISGGSNGGLLMGVQMTQRPELYKAIVIEVPLLDMLRFEKIAAGSSWTGEYGSVANVDERRFLATISPYNRLDASATYPEPLIFTTTKDDRVGPVHARKFAARMEEFGKPFYYYEILEGGHSGGADLTQQATTEAVTYTYFTRKLMD